MELSLFDLHGDDDRYTFMHDLFFLIVCDVEFRGRTASKIKICDINGLFQTVVTRSSKARGSAFRKV